MTTPELNIQFAVRLVTLFTKFVLALVMLFSVVLLFFVGSGLIKPSKSWTLITQEESLK